MRHHNRNAKFGREQGQRQALLRGLAVNLITRGRIKTTEAKAKALRRFIEPIVTKARVGDLTARRLVQSRLAQPAAAKRLVDTVAPKYKERPGGYTRIVKLAPRVSDGSPMAVIEFV